MSKTHSKDIKELIGKKCRERWADPEYKAKMKVALSGRIPWNKGKKGFTAWNKGKKYPQISGDKHYCWKGGRVKNRGGYIKITQPNDYPFKNKYPYINEHRVIMERKLGRYLKPTEIVHHINGNTADNRIENLMLFNSQSEHKKYETKRLYELEKAIQDGLLIWTNK